ncbi:MAG: hypothetical protein QXP36_05960 [Conexivisphaerales archaeon]
MPFNLTQSLKDIANTIAMIVGALGLIEVIIGIATENTYKMQLGIVAVGTSVALGTIMDAVINTISPTTGDFKNISFATSSIATAVSNVMSGFNAGLSQVKGLAASIVYYFIGASVAIGLIAADIGLIALGSLKTLIDAVTGTVIGDTIKNIGLTLVLYHTLFNFATVYRKAQMEGLPLSVPVSLGLRAALGITLVQNATTVANVLVGAGYKALDVGAVSSSIDANAFTSIANSIQNVNILIALLVGVIALLGLIGIIQSLSNIVGDVVGSGVKAALVIAFSPIGFSNFASDNTHEQGMAFLKTLIVAGIEVSAVIAIVILIGSKLTSPVIKSIFDAAGSANFVVKMGLYMIAINLPVAMMAGGTRVVKEALQMVSR